LISGGKRLFQQHRPNADMRGDPAQMSDIIVITVGGIITIIVTTIIIIITARSAITIITIAGIIITTIITIATMTIDDVAFTESCCQRARCR
jgi:hypothetical protein